VIWKSILSLVLIFCFNISNARTRTKIKLSYGLAINYPFKLHTTGFTLNANFALTEEIHVQPIFTMYLNTFPNSGSGIPSNTKETVSAWETGFYLRYLVPTSDHVGVYFSGGYAYYKSKLMSNSSSTPYEELHRLKMGLGVQIAIQKWKILGDFHFVPGKNYDFIPSLGFSYNF